MRAAFKYVTSLLFLAIVVQVGMAAVGAFNAIDLAGKDHQITKKQIENGFDPHGAIGTIVGLIILITAIWALAARVEPLMRKIALGLVGLGVLQFFFAWLGTRSAPAGFLHGINALAIYGASAFLAHRAWTRKTAESPGTAPV
jgi:hypothetical protein